MTKVQFLSRQSDWKILVALLFLLLSATIGYLLPTFEVEPTLSAFEHSPLAAYCGARFLNALIAAALLVLVWVVFRLLEPNRRYSRAWVIAKTVGIPIVWLMLIVVLGIWLSHLHKEYLDAIHPPQLFF